MVLGAGVAQAQTPLPDTHNNPTNAVTSNVTWLDNTRGTNGNMAAANFIDYGGELGDFMFGDGTGGLSIWSLKDPAHPVYVANVTPAQLRQPGDTQDRFYEGENMTVDAKRKLVFLSRDPRGFGGALTTGKTGFYIIDVKDPYKPKIVTFQSVPAGHTATCINDCQYLWSVGPYGTGTPGNNPDWFPQPAYSQKRGGVPIWVTDISDPTHPYTYPTPLDTARFDGQTGYVHSVDVDRNGIAWASGEGGVRGYYTVGTHYDPVKKVTRVATAFDPIPYAGGTTPLVNPTQDDFFGYFDHNAQHITQKVGNYPSGDLLYVTNENIVTCSLAGELKVVSLAGSYDGQGWNSTPQNPFRLNLVGHWTPWGKPGSATTGSCSAHWFTVNGNTLVQAWYGQGTRFLDMSDPANPNQVGYFRVPSGTTGVTSGSASATYWHKGLVYVADYNRGIDVLRFDGQITGTPQDGVCWGGCDGSKVTYTGTADGTAGGSVPATLSLSLGASAPSFGAFTPGIAKTYTAAGTANVVSSAGDALLSVADPSTNVPGRLVNGTFSLAAPLKASASSPAGTAAPEGTVSGAPLNLLTYNGPVSNDPVTLGFKQDIGANEALRTGAYGKTLTFTLSTTTP
ncbi:LVIVD repeat-containing protein [Solirubrobacter soli]|uniref:LVIVD repeat-containing protein n=1 Tax=Solirubrobacter soli TaxID=363832 RepID=UPI00069E870F|nr:hypothetical protein [Solirubrobacter soli]